jgi:hypothetical protein
MNILNLHPFGLNNLLSYSKSIFNFTHHISARENYLTTTLKKGIFLLIFTITWMTGFSQSYIGWVTKQVNFREGPGKEYKVLSLLKPGTQIFIISIDTANDFYNIIDIETDKEGYIHKSFVKLGEKVKKNDAGMFVPSGKTSEYNPEIEIFNNTSLPLTLKLNNEMYLFSSRQKRTITLSPGAYDYRASAPGVIPNIGTESMESNMNYTWEFYIETKRR